MWQKNMMKWKKKSKMERLDCPSNLACAAWIAHVAKVADGMVFDCTRKSIEDFSLFIKQRYRIIVWRVEKGKKVKSKSFKYRKRKIMLLSKIKVY